MQVLNVTNFPIYLPRDTAHEPLGDPLEDVVVTQGTGTTDPSFIADGYEPTNGDAVQLSFTAGGSLPSPGFAEYTTYYVISANQATGSFSLSATKGGTSISHNTVTTGGADIVLHVLSEQAQEIALPFKPGNSAVCLNLSAGTLVLQGAPDLNAAFGLPQGPGTWTQIASLAAGSAALVGLGYDWIRVSTSGTLVLMQN